MVATARIVREFLCDDHRLVVFADGVREQRPYQHYVKIGDEFFWVAARSIPKENIVLDMIIRGELSACWGGPSRVACQGVLYNNGLRREKSYGPPIA